MEKKLQNTCLHLLLILHIAPFYIIERCTGRIIDHFLILNQWASTDQLEHHNDLSESRVQCNVNIYYEQNYFFPALLQPHQSSQLLSFSKRSFVNTITIYQALSITFYGFSFFPLILTATHFSTFQYKFHFPFQKQLLWTASFFI